MATPPLLARRRLRRLISAASLALAACLALSAVSALAVGAASGRPTSATPAGLLTATATATPTPTATPSHTPTPTATPSHTPTPTATPTASPTTTAGVGVSTVTPTPVPTPPPPTPTPLPALITISGAPPPPPGSVPYIADEFADWTVTPELGGALTGWPIASAILGSEVAVLLEWAACLVLVAAGLLVVLREPIGRLRLPWQRRSA